MRFLRRKKRGLTVASQRAYHLAFHSGAFEVCRYCQGVLGPVGHADPGPEFPWLIP